MLRQKRPRANPADSSRPDVDSKWVGRPALARLLRGSIALAPVVAGVLFTYLAAPALPTPSGAVQTAIWFASLVAFSVAVMMATERVARTLLPLTVLMKLTLVFPDQAPSRFSLALRTSSTKELERTVAEVKARGLGSTEAEAAENLLVLVAALSDHDRLTRGHSERVRAYSELIGEEMQLSASDRSKLRWAGLLHDVGKLWIPADILTKPGKLTDEEFDLIKKHPEWGAALVAPLAGWLGPWIHAVGQHHERWDGGGYPNGLAGTEIALAARIVSVADVFDVITSVRSYKSASNAVEARAEIARCAGTQFDPAVVRAFLNIGLGRVQRTMWPLTMVAQVPQLIGVITAPVAGPAVSATLAAAAVTTGAIASPAIAMDLSREAPAALAFVDETVPSSTSTPGTTNDTDDSGLPAANQPTSQSALPPVTLPSTTLPSTTLPPTTLPSTTLSSTTSPPTTSPPTTGPPTTGPPTTVTSTSVPSTTTTAPAQVNGGGGGGGLDAYECLVQNDFDPQACALAGADLSGADLRGVNFDGVDLSGANLSNANLRDASLDGANLGGSILLQVDLRNASLDGSNLAGANLAWVKLRDATLRDVDLTGAILANADLREADLEGANLDGTDLSKADLRDADLEDATGTPSSWERAKFEDTECPDGSTRDESCW